MNNTPSGIMQEYVDAYNAEGDTHAKFAPSSAKRWCNCFASVKMSEGEDDGPNIYTAEGSLAHIICQLLALMVFNSMATLEELVGDTYMIDGFEIEVTEEMIEACWVYAEVLCDDMLANGLDSQHIGDIIKVEQRIQIVDGCFGTSDCNMAIPFTKLIVYDYKHGAGVPVDVEDNDQMKCYAVGALNEYEKIAGSSEMNVIELVIVQPRANHKDGPVRRWETTREQILKFKREIEISISYCKDDNPTFDTGDWCRWCPAKHKCPELFENTNEIAKAAFDVVDTGEDTLVAMTDEQMLKVLDNADTIKGFLKAVQAHAQARLEGGDSLGDYKLVRGRATRKWCDQQLVADHFQDQLGVDDLYTRKFVSPAQMEKVLKKKGVCKTVKDAKAAIFGMVDPGEGKLSLAPGHDKREQVFLNAADYFEEL